MLKAILPRRAFPSKPRTRHEWARWDAYIYTLDPDALFEEFSQRGVSFVKKLSFIDEGLWGFESPMLTDMSLPFFSSATSRGYRGASQATIQMEPSRAGS